AELPLVKKLNLGSVPLLDQATEGSCGPNTADEAIMFDQAAEVLPVASISRQFTYYTTRLIMGTVGFDSGVDNRSMLKALAKYGYCDESLWPYEPPDAAGAGGNLFTKPPQAVWDAAAKNKITSYQAVGQSLEAMKGCLVSGFPIVFGFSVYES